MYNQMYKLLHTVKIKNSQVAKLNSWVKLTPLGYLYNKKAAR